MNIYAVPGSKVIFTHPEYGSDCEQEMASEHLKLNETYTIESISIGEWTSTVFLTEAPNIGFDPIMFEDAS